MEKQLSKTHFNRRLGAMSTERSSWLFTWRDLNDNVAPGTGRFIRTDRNRGDTKRCGRIIDNTATMCLRTLSSGMMSGITSPARPWFKLRTANPALNDVQSVRLWLDNAEKVMSNIFLKSNLYTSLPVLYTDLGLYGTSCMAILEDDEDTIHCMNFPVGSYMLATNFKGQVDTVYRQYQMRVSQIVDQFGRAKGPSEEDIDWTNISITVRNLYQGGNLDAWIEVVHVIEPNWTPDKTKLEAKRKPFLSVYYEQDGDPEVLLSVSGFNELIVVAPRWDLTGEDIYGVSPGQVCLGDIRTLQLTQKRGMELLDKFTRPPMVAPASMRQKASSVLPGDVTYVDINQGGQGFVPAYQIPNPHQQDLQFSIQAVQNRIKEAFFTNLFLMIANDQREGVTATEIAARQEEKLLALGPVYLRLNDELLDPLVERTFSIMLRKALLPQPPPEMQGQMLTVEYISVMAQAMKAIGMAGIEKVSAYAVGLLQADPTVADVLNFDESVRAYAEMAGAPPKVVRDIVMVAQMRQQRQQQQQQAAQMQAMQQSSQAVHALGTAPADPSTALGQLAAQMRKAPGTA